MRAFLTSRRAPSRTRRHRHFRPGASGLEGLEARQVLSTVPVTDMTALSKQFPTHTGPTILYLNFDGSGDAIAPFQDLNGGSGDRDRDIQEILYRTAEIFAPFNVEVERMSGKGNFDTSSNGNTTIFIGAQTADVSAAGVKFSRAYTPWGYTDFPNINNITKAPNSDLWDLAYVDPVDQVGSSLYSWSNARIAANVAHEAGHTFGLAHVRSSGTDPTPLSPGATGDNDIMSYDSSQHFFENKTLRITEWNFNGTKYSLDSRMQPYSLNGSIPVPIVTQNSYTDLMALLGPRPFDDNPNLIDFGAADPTYLFAGDYRELSPTILAPGSPILGSLERRGDYDVFRYTASTAQPVFLRLLNTSFKGAELMVFDVFGKLVAYSSSTAASGNELVTFRPLSGTTYQVVVGAHDDAASGSYQLSVQQVGKATPATNSGTLIQTNSGSVGNFETVAITRNGGLVDYTRNNDVTPSPWNAGTPLPPAPGPVAAISLIQSDFSSSGNGPGDLQLVARVGDKLILYAKPDNGAWQYLGYLTADGVTVSGVTGTPALIQGRFGAGPGKHGNFELIVPVAAGGFIHLYRDNNAKDHAWHKTTPTPVGQSLGQIASLSLVESNFTGSGNGPGNLEVVARVGDKLAYFWRPDNDGWHQSAGFLSADGATITGVAGTPSMIQGRFGARGNFEMAVPLASGGFAFFWRDNDDPALPWHGTTSIVMGASLGPISTLSLIQSNYSSGGGIGNLELVARAGNRLATFWRLDQVPNTWSSGWDVAAL
jgi:hypothetical protein